LEKEKGEGIMSNLRVTIRDDSGNECPIETSELSGNTSNSSTKRESPSMTRTDTISRWTTPSVRK